MHAQVFVKGVGVGHVLNCFNAAEFLVQVHLKSLTIPSHFFGFNYLT